MLKIKNKTRAADKTIEGNGQTDMINFYRCLANDLNIQTKAIILLWLTYILTRGFLCAGRPGRAASDHLLPRTSLLPGFSVDGVSGSERRGFKARPNFPPVSKKIVRLCAFYVKLSKEPIKGVAL